METTEKVIRVSYHLMFEFSPEGEHQDIFEGMTQEEIKETCLRLAREDLVKADINSFYEELIEVEI